MRNLRTPMERALLPSFFAVICLMLWATSFCQGTKGKTNIDDDDFKQCMHVIANVTGVAGSNVSPDNYKYLTENLDQESKVMLRKDCENYFGGDSSKMMAFFRICRHPERVSISVGNGGRVDKKGCRYYKLILTAPYGLGSIDGVTKSEIEDKAVEMWICFKKEGGKYKAHLDYPLHDIIYLLQ